MSSSLLNLVQQHRATGLLVDTNILLLKCLGPNHRRTKAFTDEDYRLLESIWSRFDRIISTPSILAEVSNLIGNAPDPRGLRVMKTITSTIELIDERYTPSRTLAGTPAFGKFGLTDAAIAELAEHGILVLTDDLPLAQFLQSKKLAAINFNHLRFSR
jgi:hypothetical protein